MITKVGLVSFHTFSLPGGVKAHILGLFKEYKKKGIKVKIIVPRRKKTEDYGKDVILLGTSFPLSMSGAQGDLDVNFNQFAIERVLKREKFDVLHFHNFGFPSILQILLQSKSLNILTFHANIKGSKFLQRFPIVVKFIEKIIEWKVDGLIGVARLNLKIFKNYRSQKAVIPNGIDLEKFNPEVPKIQKFLDGKINILFLGRIEERKGLIYLLKAYKVLQKKLAPYRAAKSGSGAGYSEKIRLIVCGEGPLKEEMQDWVEKNNLKNVVFEKVSKESDAPSYFNTCDIYCSPAIFGESFGIVLLEGMACGKPVVAFDNEGYKELLTGKKGTFLVRNKNYKELAEKLKRLIKDKKLRKKMGEQGIKEAQEYSWAKVADRVLAFYELCQKEKKKRENKE